MFSAARASRSVEGRTMMSTSHYKSPDDIPNTSLACVLVRLMSLKRATEEWRMRAMGEVATWVKGAASVA